MTLLIDIIIHFYYITKSDKFQVLLQNSAEKCYPPFEKSIRGIMAQLLSLITPTQYLHSETVWISLCEKKHLPKICIILILDYPEICIILILEYPKICIGLQRGSTSSQLLHVLCDETLLKIFRFYAIISAEKQVAVLTHSHNIHTHGGAFLKQFLKIF